MEYVGARKSRLIRFRERFLSHTIWAIDAMPEVPPRYRIFAHVVYPVIYGLNVIVYGVIGGQTGGSTILRESMPAPGANILCGIIGFSALIGLCGIVFGGGPRRAAAQQVERFGALLLILPTLAYFILLTIALAGPDGSAPLAALVGTVVVILFALIRALDLSTEIGKRASTHRSAI
jgi:hypothetical protein